MSFDRSEFAKHLVQQRHREYDSQHPAPSDDELETMFVDAWAEHEARKAAELEADVERQVAIRGKVDERSGLVAKTYLFNWDQIEDALGLGREQRNTLRKLNRDYGGPIVIAKQGSQPKASRAELLKWWNGLEDRFSQLVDKTRDREATVADTYQHGRSGEVVPGIAGSVKRRRAQ